jgi:hypothetical protein
MSTFIKPPDLEQITLAKSSDINAITAATKAAFDLLPDENDLKTGAINYAQTSGGVANAYVVTMKDAALNFYQDGMQVIFKPVATNTSSTVSIIVNGLGSKSIILPTGQPISANDISINAPVSLRYSSTIVTGGAFVIDPNSSNYATIATTQAGIATTKADSATLSESNALTYKSNASSSANAAASSATTAQDWATKLTPVSGSDYGAKKYAIDASAAAGSASTSASNASDSLTDTIGNALEASNWAKLTNALVPIYNESTNSTSTSGSDYSAKEYAIGTTVESAKRHASGTTATGSAKDWAVKTVGEVVTGQGYSAFYYAGLASGSATTANTAAGSATTSAANASDSLTDTNGYKSEALRWANNTGSTVGVYNATTNAVDTGTEYSAKEYAVGTTVTTGSAKDWATKTASEVVTGQGFGAKKYANDASGYATTASTQAGIATTQATNAAVSATSALNAPGTSATSTNSLVVGTGSKSFTIAQTGKLFSIGQTVSISDSTGLNGMSGQITAFTSGTGAITVNVTDFIGSGTIASWTVSLGGMTKKASVFEKICYNSVSAGQLVSVNPNGTISKTLAVGIVDSISTTAITDTLDYKFYDKYSGYFFAISYTGGVNYLVISILTDSGMVRLSETAFFTGAQIAYDYSISFDYAHQKVLISYLEGGYLGTSRVGSVSKNGSVVFEAPVVFSNIASGIFSSVYDSIANKFVIIFTTILDNGTVIVGSLSGSTISFGTPVVNYQNPEDADACFDSTNGKVVIVYRDRVQLYLFCMVGTVLDMSISFNAKVSVQANNSFSTPSCIYISETNKIIIGYGYTINSNTIAAVKIGDISAGQISLGYVINIDTSITDVFTSVSCAYDAQAQKLISLYVDTGNVTKIRKGVISENSLSLESALTLTNIYNLSIFFDYSAKKVIASSNNFISSSHTENNINSCIGIAQADGTAGTEINVATIGAIDSNQSALTIGADYYPTDTGTLTSTANSYKPIGKALTVNSLLITLGLKGDQGIQGVAGSITNLTGSSANQVIGINSANNNTEFKTLVAGTNITIDNAANSITINSTGGGGGGTDLPTLHALTLGIY